MTKAESIISEMISMLGVEKAHALSVLPPDPLPPFMHTLPSLLSSLAFLLLVVFIIFFLLFSVLSIWRGKGKKRMKYRKLLGVGGRMMLLAAALLIISYAWRPVISLVLGRCHPWVNWYELGCTSNIPNK